jgi:HAD superfamily hydrolase (TIGR01509 family)
MSVPTIFLDDGGVLNDNTARAPQWRRLVGRFLAPVLGGSEEAWGDANVAVMTAILEPAAWAARLEAATDYANFQRRYHLDWLTAMCALVGVAGPSEEEAILLAGRAERWILPQVGAAFPGAADTVRALHAAGYRVCTASGSSSEYLDVCLRGMGIRRCFEHLYGPDLVETFKNGPMFYERIFADAGMKAEETLVVDDSSLALGWAAAAGASTVLVNGSDGPGQGHVQIRSLRDLPGVLLR